MDPIVLEGVAVVTGLWFGTLLVSRIGNWIHAVVVAQKASREEPAPKSRMVLALVLNAGPWIAAATIYWAYYVLSTAHARAWDLFFGSAVIAIGGWVAYIAYRNYREKGRRPKTDGA